MDKERSIDEFSLLDPATQDDPFEFYAAMQRSAGIYQMPETGFFIVSRYDDLRAVLTDPKTFSNDVDRASLQGPELSQKHDAYMAEHGWPHIQTLQRTDAPAHSRYRKLVDRVFTRARVRDMTDRIDRRAHQLIDAFADRGTCEFVSEFALLLPGSILAEEMGLPPTEVATFKRWADAMLAPASIVMSEDELRAVADIELEAQHHLAKLFEDRRNAPRDDLISALVHAHVENEDPLTMAELQSVMSQLIGGGFESTKTAISKGMWQLLQNPDQMGMLRDDRSLMENFAHEVVRIESPTQGLRRRTTRDVELAGTLIPKNSIVIVRYGAANRDPEKFECPHQFDVTRSNASAHLGFGIGPHFCVGAVLARQEIVSGISAMLDRFSAIELARPLVPPIHHASFLTLSLRELPIRFSV